MRVTVLTGGSTPERDVALAGAGQVRTALANRGHDVRVVDTTVGELITPQQVERLDRPVAPQPPAADTLENLRRREDTVDIAALPAIREADVVFLVLHGSDAEGGAVQAMLDRAGILYTGSGPFGSALAMDKDIAKRLFRFAGLSTPDWRMWPARPGDLATLGFPLVVKPSRVGSTVGLTVVNSSAEIDDAVAEARRWDDEIICEALVSGPELTVGILGDRALSVGEIRPAHDIFDYECKYTPGMCEEIFPAPVPAPLAERVRAAGLAAHRALKLQDYSRVDFRLGPDDALFILEANTLPGLTAGSLLPQSAAAAGIGFESLCEEICEAALTRGREP